MYTIMNTI